MSITVPKNNQTSKVTTASRPDTASKQNRLKLNRNIKAEGISIRNVGEGAEGELARHKLKSVNDEAQGISAGTSQRLFYREKEIVGSNGILPISSSTFRRLIQKGLLPRPIKLGNRCSLWDASELHKAIQNLGESTINT